MRLKQPQDTHPGQRTTTKTQRGRTAMQQAIQESFLTTSVWGQLHGLTRSRVEYLCNTGKLKYCRIKGKKYISESTLPNESEHQGWLSVLEFARKHNMSESWARRLVALGKVRTSRQAGKTVIAADTVLVRTQTTLRSGRQFVSFQPLLEVDCA